VQAEMLTRPEFWEHRNYGGSMMESGSWMRVVPTWSNPQKMVISWGGSPPFPDGMRSLPLAERNNRLSHSRRGP
jgi:hypothetical protein